MVNLANEPKTIDTTLDSVVIVNALETIVGGRALDVVGFGDTVIKAGHVVIKEDGVEHYRPMPFVPEDTGAAYYQELPDGYSIVGIVGATVLANRAACSIVVRGTVNEVAAPIAFTPEIKAALPLIRFVQD